MLLPKLQVNCLGSLQQLSMACLWSRTLGSPTTSSTILQDDYGGHGEDFLLDDDVNESDEVAPY